MHGRHTRMRPHHWAAIIGTVAVILSLALVVAWFDRTQNNGPSATSTASSPAARRSSAAAAEASRQLRTCEAVWRAQSRTLRAADRSLEQWQVHVGAMNQLVAGKITLTQAMDFWSRTRVGAAARVARFETAAGRYATVEPRCGGASAGTRPAGTSRALTACRVGVRARNRAIEAGSVAVTTWKHHIMDMEALRAGKITPQHALQMWLMNWHLGVRQLHTYSRISGTAADAGSCAAA